MWFKIWQHNFGIRWRLKGFSLDLGLDAQKPRQPARSHRGFFATVCFVTIANDEDPFESSSLSTAQVLV
jgi:hypothetical protein